MDLFDKALESGAYIVESLEQLAQSEKFNKDDIYELIIECSSITGLRR